MSRLSWLWRTSLQPIVGVFQPRPNSNSEFARSIFPVPFGRIRHSIMPLRQILDGRGKEQKRLPQLTLSPFPLDGFGADSFGRIQYLCSFVGANLVFAPSPEPYAHSIRGRIQDSPLQNCPPLNRQGGRLGWG